MTPGAMQPFSSKRTALLTLGAAASDAMLWRAHLDHEENAETGKPSLWKHGQKEQTYRLDLYGRNGAAVDDVLGAGD
jgi:hypothetical protein